MASVNHSPARNKRTTTALSRSPADIGYCFVEAVICAGAEESNDL